MFTNAVKDMALNHLTSKEHDADNNMASIFYPMNSPIGIKVSSQFSYILLPR